jgi:hypothetical protein
MLSCATVSTWSTRLSAARATAIQTPTHPLTASAILKNYQVPPARTKIVQTVRKSEPKVVNGDNIACTSMAFGIGSLAAEHH